MSGIELILDESVDDGALPHGLISNEHDFELDGVFLISGIADLIVVFTHYSNYKSSDCHIL